MEQLGRGLAHGLSKRGLLLRSVLSCVAGSSDFPRKSRDPGHGEPSPLCELLSPALKTPLPTSKGNECRPSGCHDQRRLPRTKAREESGSQLETFPPQRSTELGTWLDTRTRTEGKTGRKNTRVNL